jgi:hypothetical protein
MELDKEELEATRKVVNIDKEIKKIVKYCRARECEECIYFLSDELCALHNPSAWNV